MLTIKVTESEILNVVEDNTSILSVQFQISEGEEVLATMRHGFPLDVDPEVLKAELAKTLATFESDRESVARCAENDAKNDSANETMKNLEGLTITNEKSQDEK